ncbi:hypothetical protein SprV_0301341700 [Sparganum proliferum]
MLVQQLIVGLRDEKARENVLSEKKDLSWEKACDTASHQERVRQKVQQLNQSNDGVIASLEFEMAVSLVNTAVSSSGQRPSAPSKQLPSCYRCAGDGEAIFRMFSADALLQSPHTITLPVDHHPAKFEIDIGSAVTLINEASLQKLPSLLPASSTFRSYTGQNVEVRGDLFRDDSATHYRGPPVKFQFQSDFRPRFLKDRTVPYAVTPKVEEELDRLQKADIIEPMQYSEWAAPIVPVLKSDGSVRICGDYKLTINSASKLNPYPLPRIEDLFRPVKKHADADAMSRRSTDTNDKLPTGDFDFVTVLTISEPTRHHWAIAQGTDPYTNIVYDHQLNGGHHPTDTELCGSSETARIIRSHWANCFMENDLLFFKGDVHSQPQLVIPGSLVLPILDDLRSELGHPSNEVKSTNNSLKTALLRTEPPLEREGV